ncbi:MAG: GntR family transcriptional regulator [Alcaligenaceae bacterium]|nr:GntR family transcriptional regulator [Alcaligenaceae bacterium]
MTEELTVLGLAGLPRYQLVAQALVDDINAGRYEVGELLPTEAELCEQFNVSRYTVREALRQLSELGLIVRQAGVGTRLVERQSSVKYMQTSNGVEDLYKFVRDIRLEIVSQSIIVCDRATSNLLGCPQGQEWVYLRGNRYAASEDTPIAITDVYVAKQYQRILDEPRDCQVPVYSLIEKIYGFRIIEIKQDISAVLLDSTAAAVFNEKPGSAALQVIRKYYGPGKELVEVAVSLHPGSRFTYSSTQRLVS